jgi:hypothetical protein
MMLPMIMKIRVMQNNMRVISIWLPLFLLWPFVLVLLVLALPLVMLGCLITGDCGRGTHLLPLLAGGFQLAISMRGLDVTVKNQTEGNHVEVRFT